jgi:hypothetical protein
MERVVHKEYFIFCKKKPSKTTRTNGAMDLFIEFLPAVQFTCKASIKGSAHYTEPKRNQGENIAKMRVSTVQVNRQKIMYRRTLMKIWKCQQIIM